MTREAYKFLQLRLARIQISNDPMPDAIVKAKKLINDYEHASYLRDRKARKVLERRRDKVREVIHAGDYDLALKAVKALEDAQ